jgi:hypothetical protein
MNDGGRFDSMLDARASGPFQTDYLALLGIRLKGFANDAIPRFLGGIQSLGFHCFRAMSMKNRWAS